MWRLVSMSSSFMIFPSSSANREKILVLVAELESFPRIGHSRICSRILFAAYACRKQDTSLKTETPFAWRFASATGFPVGNRQCIHHNATYGRRVDSSDL